VETDLANAGVPSGQIVRITGDAATEAASIATTLDRRTASEKTALLPSFDAVTIANPNSPDAAAASTMAVNRRFPFLYVNQGSIPTATQNVLGPFALNVKKAYIIGGPAVVSTAVETQLQAAGITTVRLGGADQYATSAAVLQESINQRVPNNQVFLADGNVPLHGALLGASSGRIGGLELLTHGASSAEAETVLSALGVNPRLDRLIHSALARGTAFDFTGNGTANVGVYRPGSNAFFVQGRSPEVTPYGNSGDIPVVGDYDGDGVTDVAVYSPSSGTWSVHQSTGGDTALVYGGQPNDVPVPADYNGDHKTDIAIYRPSTGVWYIHNSNGTDTALAYGGLAGDIPVPADYDGDGKADIAIFRPSNGVWYVHNSSGGDTALAYGTTGDVPVPADYDGDGKADVAVYRPTTGTWFIHNSTGGDTAITYGGISGDIAVPADYDGDGKADIAIFRGGAWYIHKSTGGDLAFTYGIPGDIPLTQPAATRLLA
jgi:hypothetical protein